MNEENVFKLTDIINTPQVVSGGVSGGVTPDSIMKTIESIFSTVTKFQEKAQQFQMLYGRTPANKQELKSGRPLVAIDQYTPATQERMNRQPKTENVKEMRINFDDEKFYTIVQNTFDGLFKMAEPYKDLKVEEAIKKIDSLKGLIVPKVSQNLKNAVLECVNIE